MALIVSLIGRAHPVDDELLKLRDVRPAEPGARAGARNAEVDGGIDDVRPLPPRVKQVPAALIGRLPARPDNQLRRPIRCPEDDLEAEKVLNLQDPVPCRGCGARGRAAVSIKWAKSGAC
jgi:hypothetical protein